MGPVVQPSTKAQIQWTAKKKAPNFRLTPGGILVWLIST
jgi:hypothetical protein